MAFHTDVGIRKHTNQDSLCVKQAKTDKGSILLVVICDGMGGLEKGELASASIIYAFSQWFESQLPLQLGKANYVEEIRYQWDRMMKQQNQMIAQYGREHRIQLGSTITAMLILEDGTYLVGHVGDCRLYRITSNRLDILTQDQTVVAREVRNGTLTQEQAEVDPRRNVLLQCVGASRIVEPDFFTGHVTVHECYMLCSDGFRHKITEEEIRTAFSPEKNEDEGVMKDNIVYLVERNKERGETDNISAILIKTV